MNLVDENLAARLRRHLAAQLTADNDLRTQPWTRAIETVPRELFLGGCFFRRIDGDHGTTWEPIVPDDPTQWISLVYENETWVTQLDGRDTLPPPGPVTGAPTSSSTLPGLVISMLEDLDVQDGHRVLEIGTGTGYSTALLCQRLGDSQVTSIEVDPGVGGRARAALLSAGYKPTAVVRDGLNGWPGGAPYDRVIATCSVRTLPAPWIQQTNRGGIILATMSGWLHGSALARVTVTGPDSALGEFLPGTVSFMPARPHAGPPIGDLPPMDGGEERAAVFGGDVLADWTGRWIAQLAVPGAQSVSMSIDGGPVAHCVIDQAAQAWAWLIPDGDGWIVRQSGPVRLWDQVEGALEVWHRACRPPQQSFRLHVTDGKQTVFLPGASTLRWDLPA